MKRVRIVNGIKRIEDSDTNATLFRLRDVIMEHRAILISRVVNDLATYIDYKFRKRITSKQSESVKEHLYTLKNSNPDLDRYNMIIDHFFNHEITYIGTEPFLREIDETINAVINASQLQIES
jgi:hypothetical protein